MDRREGCEREREMEEKVKVITTSRPRGKDKDQRPYKDWENPKTGETAHPDFKHGPPEGPHWDIKGPTGRFRITPGGGVPVPK